MALTSPGLIRAANEMLVALKPEINMIKAFAYDLSDDLAGYGAKVRVPFVTAGTAENYGADNCADTNTGNYGHATGGLSDVFVTLDAQPKVTIPVTSNDVLELPNDGYWAKCVEAGRDAIGTAISKKIGGLFTAANCLGGKVTMATVTKKALANLRSQCVGRIRDTVLILAPDYYEEAISLFDSYVYGDQNPVVDGQFNGLYGFRTVLCGYDLPDGIKGALVPYTSVAVAVKPVAIPDAAAYPEAGVTTDESGFSITSMRHTDFNTATCFFNTTCLIGADVIRKNDVKYISAS